MEAARAFISKHTGRTGHRTDVEEIVNPAVTWETVKPHRHEVITEAVDREVHQHHYHTTVQPLNHTVTLPEKHVHNLIPIKHVTHQKEDTEATKARLAAELAQFKNSSVTLPTTHSSKVHAPVIGTHYHHHVHETVQPIIYKETHVPEVVHTSIPIHEKHYYQAEHHGISALPLKTLAEFEKLSTPRRSVQNYEGSPRPYDSSLATTFEKLGLGHGHHHNTAERKELGINTAAANAARPTHRRRGSSSSNSSASSASSMEQPMTPRSPGRHSHEHRKTRIAPLNTTPMKDVGGNQPVQIDPLAYDDVQGNDKTVTNPLGFVSDAGEENKELSDCEVEFRRASKLATKSISKVESEDVIVKDNVGDEASVHHLVENNATDVQNLDLLQESKGFSENFFTQESGAKYPMTDDAVVTSGSCKTAVSLPEEESCSLDGNPVAGRSQMNDLGSDSQVHQSSIMHSNSESLCDSSPGSSVAPHCSSGGGNSCATAETIILSNQAS